MGFFSDLKQDLSQAVNELLPDENVKENAEQQEASAVVETESSEVQVVAQETEEAAVTEDSVDLEKMLENIDAVPWTVEEVQEEASDVEAQTQETCEEEAAVEKSVEESSVEGSLIEGSLIEESLVEEALAEESLEEDEYDLEKMLANALASGTVYTEEKVVENKGAEKKMDSYTTRIASDETSIITAGMTITGDITSEGSMDVIGNVNGNIDILGKLNITGHITGNSKAAEIYAEGAKINGEVVSEGAVKIGASSVVIGNIIATSAAIAGAVKGDIDVKGPVILDASAIVMGNIKSKSVQINNGAVIEGMCSQCYADVNPTSFFDDYKPEMKKGRK